MKTISSGLATHIASDLTTLCTCWLVTRRDSTVFGFTDAATDIVYGGVTYKASTGLTPSSIQTTDALNVDNLEVISMLDAAAITDADLLAGKWDYAAVQIFLLNWADLAQAALQLRRGWTGEIKTGRASFTAELRGMTQPLQQDIGRVFMPSCNADLGDTRCSINLAAWTLSGTVTSVTDAANFAASGRSEATDYFTGGKLTWTGGNNAGWSMEVKSFGATTFGLTQAMPLAIQIGDTFSVYAGCNKNRDAGGCLKFSNILNFRGFPDVPGIDRVLSGT